MALSPRHARLVRFLVRAAVLAVLQAALLRLLAGADVVSVALGAGRDTPLPLLLLAGGYLFLRVWVVLALPGLLAYELVCWAAARPLPLSSSSPTSSQTSSPTSSR